MLRQGPQVALAIALVGCSSTSAPVVDGPTYVTFAVAGSSAVRPVTLTTNRGVAIVLEQAYVVVSRVEIRSCDATAWQRVWRAFDPLPLAHAHSTSSFTALGNPLVDDALRSPSDLLAIDGQLAAPAGSWCSVRVTIEAADADAAHLPSDTLMAGKSVHLSGQLTDAMGSKIPFVIEDSTSVASDALIDRLDFSRAEPRSVRLVVESKLATWLDDIDFEHDDENTKFRTVLANIRKSISVRTVEAR